MKIRDETSAQVRPILTPEQQAKMDVMKKEAREKALEEFRRRHGR